MRGGVLWYHAAMFCMLLCHIEWPMAEPCMLSSGQSCLLAI